MSIEGLGDVHRRAPGDTARGGGIGLSARTPFDCLQSIADQAGPGGCLMASSTPTLGMLYPYPGLDNTFVPQAFVGGGENNEATVAGSTVGGGRDNTASGDYVYSGTVIVGYATVAGGRDNQARTAWSTVGGGYINTASGNSATVGGGRGNTAYGGYATVGGGSYNTVTGFNSTVGGGRNNTASVANATIAGGAANSATAYATVAGGSSNNAAGIWATVAGGSGNNASGGRWPTVGGGRGNTASGDAVMVGGGKDNSASGSYATVAGGSGNTASGYSATVPGGRSNTAQGNHGFAAGRRAKADHDGAFVWGDSFDGDKASSSADEFNVYCSGGARFFTNTAATTGVLLAPGGSTWTMVSDREAKENIEPVDARAVLDKVADLPLATWNYKAQDDSIRHMGPMAQDFHSAFGLGLGETTIDTIDPNGVALAAIQGLNAALGERLAEKDAEIEELRAALRQADEELRGRVERLEVLVRAAMAK